MVDIQWRDESEHGFAAERAGRWEEAARIFRDLFSRAVQARDLSALTEAVYCQARVLPRLGAEDEAAEMAELSLEIARRHGLLRMVARTLNLLALAHFARGEHAPAQTLYLHALDQARDVGDDTLVGFVCQNLGVIANIQGNLREARVLYLESIGAATRAANKSNAIMAYNNLGMVCTDLGEAMEAGIYFDRGIEIAERLQEFAQLGRLYVNRAEPLIQIGEYNAALASLERAEGFATRVGSHATLADVARFRARVARLRGQHAAADRHVQDSLRIAGQARLALLRGEALEEFGELRRAQGNDSEAVRLLEEALACFREVGAQRDAERATSILAQWSSGGAGPQPERNA